MPRIPWSLLLVIPVLLCTCSSIPPAPAASPPAAAPAIPLTSSVQATAPAPDSAGADSAQGASVNALPPAVAAQLDALLASQVYAEGDNPALTAPGLVLLVDTPQGRYLNAAGASSLEKGTAMLPPDRLEIGSDTKSSLVVLLLQLQEEGVLSLDDPLAKELPDLAAKIPTATRSPCGNSPSIPAGSGTTATR